MEKDPKTIQANSVDEYLQELPQPMRVVLEALRPTTVARTAAHTFSVHGMPVIMLGVAALAHRRARSSRCICAHSRRV